MITRRVFLASGVPSLLAQSSERVGRPSLLVRATDEFCNLPTLRTRYAAGLRPSEDMNGLAIAWHVTGDRTCAERAIAMLGSGARLAAAKANRNWVDVARWALAFDWLYDAPNFDPSLKDRIANELLACAETALRTRDLANPAQVSYHNYSVRYLAVAAFGAAAAQTHPATSERANELRKHVEAAFENVLQLTELVSPDGSYHESLDYMRITWAALVAIAELMRTTSGIDAARHFGVFRGMAETYLYKLLPDGTPSREGDNEYPILDERDTAVLGYAVHRFKDPYAAWLLRRSGFTVSKWTLPVLQFLWDDPEVTPRDPALSRASELPRQKHFRGVDQLVMRQGWDRGSTWIEFDCGPYFAKHQHLDRGQFTIYHRGYLAIDSGADYTDTESPHYLNYFRRSVAHNTILVVDPEEKFFWSENVVPAANDGGQRMDSSRFWNTVRSLEDWRRTRDLWDLARLKVVDHVAGAYHYACGDATRAYSATKLTRFTRELLYDPVMNVLLVFDRVRSKRPEFRKVWLLHGVNEPQVDGASFRFREQDGELLAHCLLPHAAHIVKRGGEGNEFWTPCDAAGGGWGSGKNWPLEPAGGGPLPEDPQLQKMWKTFWGAEFNRILPSNRRNVVPGAWRVEVNPAVPSMDDVFLHAIEIGDRGKLPGRRMEAFEGVNVAGALVERGLLALFATATGPLLSAEVTVPDVPFQSLMATSLVPDAMYEIHATGPNIASSVSTESPGTPVRSFQGRANENGVLRIDVGQLGNVRLRLTSAAASSGQEAAPAR